MEREVRFIQFGKSSGFILFSSEGESYPQSGQEVMLHTHTVHVKGIYKYGYVDGLIQLPKPNEIVLLQWT